jgi:cytochrome c oxidase subunit 4
MSQLEPRETVAGAEAPSTHGGALRHLGDVRFYVAVFVALLCCTLLTVAVSSVHLGALNLVVAIVIASMKATLVVLFFMHLATGSRFNAMILIVSLMMVGVFFAYTLNDTGRRTEVDVDQSAKVSPATGLPAPGGAD